MQLNIRPKTFPPLALRWRGAMTGQRNGETLPRSPHLSAAELRRIIADQIG